MFKEVLDKLSISSKEAVIDGNLNSFDDFKNYLHIERYVESKLENLVLSSLKSNKPKLILISGNVGDGKSHMMSRLYKNYPEEMSLVAVRNDATESNDVNKSWIDELSEFMDPYKDHNLQNYQGNQTRIVAINLGVLSSFIDITEGNFNILKSYVTQKGIIDSLSSNNYDYDENSYFQYINLADYNLFTLTKDRASSVLILQLLNKITIEDDSNPFYKSFLEFYSDHPNINGCSMRYNYLELRKKNVQEGLASILIYSIIKYKMIISIRDLLNFIYDLIVPFEFSNLSSSQIKSDSTSISSGYVLKNSLYNRLFDSSGRSHVYTSLKKLDPIKLRTQLLDSLIFKLSSTETPLQTFKEYGLGFNSEWQAPPYTFERKEFLIKTFIRSLYLNEIQTFEDEHSTFIEFSRYLFSYYAGDKTGLKPLYKVIIKAIYCWNGNSKIDNEINLPLGRKQLKYNVTQQTNLTPLILIHENQEFQKEINEFYTSIKIGMKAGKNNITFGIDINLFVLLKNVIKGYSPNKFDRENHTDFQQSVDKITILSSQNKPINFELINGSKRQRFELTYENEFGYEFFRK